MLIDIHSHLDIIKEKEEILKNSKEIKIVTCGGDKKSNRATLKLKEKFPELEICLGIYPSNVLKVSEKEILEEINFIRNSKNKIFGIGEVGLDLKENPVESLEKQKKFLEKFVLLAKELNKPIVIHSRKAEGEAINFLEELNYKKIIMHCFSGKLKLVEKIIANGWFLSIPTSVKNSEHFQKVIEMCPIENLFCETDSPFLHPDKKFPNEPKNVIESYKKISEIKKIPLEEVEKKIEENFENIRD